MIFSLFHALTFARTTLLPHFFPPGPPTTEGGPPQPHPIAKRLQVWVKGTHLPSQGVLVVLIEEYRVKPIMTEP
jgi:transmembrane protein 33